MIVCEQKEVEKHPSPIRLRRNENSEGKGVFVVANTVDCNMPDAARSACHSRMTAQKVAEQRRPSAS